MATTAELKIKCLLQLAIPVVAVVINEQLISVICRSQEDAEKVGRLFQMANLQNIVAKQRHDSFDGQHFWQTDAKGTIEEIQKLEKAA